MVEPRLEQQQAGHQPRASSSCDEPPRVVFGGNEGRSRLITEKDLRAA